VSIQDDDVNVKLTLEQTSFSAYYELGLAEGHYAQWGSRHVDVYAFARGPADENGIPTAVNMSDLQKDELKTKLSKQDTKMLTDEIDIKDAQHNLVDIEAVVQVNKGVNIQTVEQAVMKSIYDFFNPELWEFGQRLNTVEIEKAIYNAASGIEDIILVNPQTAIESASYQLISKGNLNITFEYVV
jgi:phage-related baseplate assembly protein